MARDDAAVKDKRDVGAEIAELERKMDMHRERLKRDAGAAAAAARRKAKPLPLVGLVALAGVGFAFARMTRSRPPAGPTYIRQDGRWYEPTPRTSYDQGWQDGERRRSRASGIGKLAAVTGAAVRFGMSPQARFLWNAVQRRRDRY